jgi:cysteinyl-tRNA synthetase
LGHSQSNHYNFILHAILDLTMLFQNMFSMGFQILRNLFTLPWNIVEVNMNILFKLFSAFGISLFLLACSDGKSTQSNKDEDIDYRAEMRAFVIELSEYAKSKNPDFIIIPQNGHDLLTENGEPDGPLASEYISAIDGIGREDLNFGYNEDDIATPEDEQSLMTEFMQLAQQNEIQVLVTDYCTTPENVNQSYQISDQNNFITFAANSRDLNSIPTFPAGPHNINANDVEKLSEAQNFLYFLDPSIFINKAEYLDRISATNYDLLLVDFFYEDAVGDVTPLSALDVRRLQYKSQGSRLAISYMSIGEAEDYRYYWESSWNNEAPEWLADENPEWDGNYKVKYWDPEWKNLIYGSETSYLDQIINAEFDGVYLDIIDAFEYFENN